MLNGRYLYSLDRLIDSKRIEQVIDNVLQNAIKFAGKGCSVTVNSYVKAQEAVICITDNGPGVKLDEQERIFDRFYRSEKSQTRRHRAGAGDQ